MSNKLPLDSNYDLEQQFILRMMDPNVSKTLSAEIDAGVSFKENFTVEFKPDLRHAIVRYNGQVYQGQIMDLPCIIESLKTTDKKTFYKTADICQMLVCTQGDENGPLRGSAGYLDRQFGSCNAAFDENESRKFQFLHGITPPLKNVLRRRFRKTRKKRLVDMPKIEKEVKQLLRADLQADGVKWELIWNDPNQPANRIGFGEKSNPTSDNLAELDRQEQVAADDEIEDDDGIRDYAINHQDVFGEISSSSLGSSSGSSDDEHHDEKDDQLQQPSKRNAKKNQKSSSLYSSHKPESDLALSLSQMKDTNELAAELLLSDSEDEDELGIADGKGGVRAHHHRVLYESSCTLADDDELQASVAAVGRQTAFHPIASSQDLADDDDDEEDLLVHRGGELLDDISYMGFNASVAGDGGGSGGNKPSYDNPFNMDEDSQETL